MKNLASRAFSALLWALVAGGLWMLVHPVLAVLFLVNASFWTWWVLRRGQLRLVERVQSLEQALGSVHRTAEAGLQDGHAPVMRDALANIMDGTGRWWLVHSTDRG